MTRDEWLRAHAYLQPVATWIAEVDAAAAGIAMETPTIPSFEEYAALTLGASGWKTFFLVSLPKIRWGLLYGTILCTARSMGEFGAVSVVSGHIRGRTNTLPLHVEILYNEYQFTAAFAAASLLTLLALATLGIQAWLAWRGERRPRVK